MDTSWIITQVFSGNKTLIVFYDQMEYGLFNLFSSNSEIETFIKEDIDTAFNKAVFKKKDGPYFLNIASVEKLGAFSWNAFTKSHLNHLLAIYMPIIQKFIADARTGTIKCLLDEETNPKEWMALTVYQ